MRILILTIIMAVYIFSGCQQPKGDDLTLPAIFSSHMVLQQSVKAPFWGTAQPESLVKIKASWDEKVETISDAEGNWKVDVQTPKAGDGPYHVAVSSGDSTLHINDVLIGEVWLCSGQSNMEMPLKGWLPNEPVENSNDAIRSAHFQDIRFFTVERTVSTIEQDHLKGRWEACNPRSASYFSATAFYFGRKLHNELKVPIGLIHSSWGGSPAEAWTKGKDLAQLDDYQDVMENLENALPQQQIYESWLEKLEQIDISQKPDESSHTGLDFADEKLSAPEHDHGDWPKMDLPGLWEYSDIGNFNGVVWFRKSIDIPFNWTNTTLIFELAFIDDMDRTYVNGNLVGGYETIGFWNAPRRYDLPPDKNNSTSINIAIRVIDTGGGGGIYGSAEQMRVYPENDPGQAISLAGPWSYLVVGEYRGGNYFKYGSSLDELKSRPPLDMALDHNTPTVLYNGMIAPLTPYAIKGVTWYQGEANVNEAEIYTELFPAMIKSWRTAWGGERDFPFYFVQIAPFNYSGKDNRESAELRESQRISNLSVPNTGMVVTLDIGNLGNIHPPKKREVGERLAALALHGEYGKEHLPYSGPVIDSMILEGRKVRLKFSQAGSGLKAKDGVLEGFEIAGEDGKFATASAKIEGEDVVIDNPDGYEKVTVRYAFRNGSKASLFNKEGFPASTFEISLDDK